jgi:hypothetical protein
VVSISIRTNKLCALHRKSYKRFKKVQKSRLVSVCYERRPRSGNHVVFDNQSSEGIRKQNPPISRSKVYSPAYLTLSRSLLVKATTIQYVFQRCRQMGAILTRRTSCYSRNKKYPSSAGEIC